VSGKTIPATFQFVTAGGRRDRTATVEITAAPSNLQHPPTLDRLAHERRAS
jgi:hypothetical protein